MRRPTLNYLRTESGAGLLLAAAAALAVVIANSPYAGRYFAFAEIRIPVRFGSFVETLSVAGWTRTALMPLFFLVLGMQTKFEVLRGELSNLRRLGLPIAAALGGFAVPAAIFAGVALARGGSPAGWPIGAATDEALALSMLALAGPRLPASLRILLMSVALADDLLAVGLAAVLQATRLDAPMLAGAGAVLVGLALLSRWRQAPFLFYAAGFGLVWGFVLKSGLDPSLAGIACAFTVPIGMRRPGQDSTLKYFMDSAHPYVAFSVLPLFVFAASGFSLRDIAPGDLLRPLPLAIAAALCLGKPLGVFGGAWLATVAKLGRRPVGAAWSEIAGVAMLSGVGLTTSLFLVTGALAGAAQTQAAARLAVVAGSALAAIGGAWMLNRALVRRAEQGADVPIGDRAF